MNLYRQKVQELENFIRDNGLDISELFEVKHHFAHGTYTRELRVPAGIVIIGKEHRHSTTNILLKGSLLLLNEDGTTEEIRAPRIFVSKPNTKKTAHTLEDVIFLNVHPWDGKMNLEELEQELIVNNQLEAQPCLGQQ